MMQLFVKGFDYKTNCIIVDSDITYNELKNIIADRLHYDQTKCQFQLILGGKYLEANEDIFSKITDIGITNECTIYLKESIFPPVKII